MMPSDSSEAGASTSNGQGGSNCSNSGVAVAAVDRRASRGLGSRKGKNAQDEEAKEEVRRKLLSGEYILVEDKKNQSLAWQKFGKVAIPNGNPDSDAPPTFLKFVKCLNPTCDTVKVLSSGRGALASHVCRVKEAVTVTPPTADIACLETGVIELLVKKLLPIDLIEYPEFAALLQLCANLGAKYSKVDMASLLPSRKTLTEHLKAKAHTARQELVEEMRESVEDGLVSATVDGWTDPQRGRKFLAHTTSYINSNFELKENVLFTPHCDAESVTTDVIREVIKTGKAELSLDPDSEFHYTTDDGADIKALTDNRTYCADHATNLLVKKALTLQLTKVDLYGADGGAKLDLIKKAVDTLKSSRKNVLSNLKNKIQKFPQDRKNQTRFKSSLPMLRKVKQNFSEMKRAMKQLGCKFLDSISLNDIKDIDDLIRPLEVLAFKTKDHCFVANHKEKLDNLTSRSDKDSELMAQMKEHVKSELLIISILQLIQKCKQVVTLLKTSGLNDRLKGGSLKQEVETRWMSLLHMLRSFFPSASSKLTEEERFSEINDILISRGKRCLVLSEEDRSLMKELIAILSPFEEAIKKLEAEKQPTIHHVYPQYLKLKKVTAPDDSDNNNPILAKLKERLNFQLDNKLKKNLSMRHKVGTFLWPNFASQDIFPDDEREEVLATVRSMVNEQQAIIDRRAADSLPKEPPSKRQRRSSDSDSEDECSTIIQQPNKTPTCFDDVGRYLLIAQADSTLKSSDLLAWWKDKSPMFPALARVARKILATPASSAASERNFSVAGRLINSRRNCLSPEMVDVILFLHNYVSKYGSLPKTAA